MVTSFQNLLNGAAKSMNVNGFITPQTFSYSPGMGNTAAISGVTVLLRDEGTASFDKFGAITALSNGLLLQVTINGNTRTLSTIKDNGDFCTRFHFNQFGNGAVLSLLSIVTPEGFGNSNNVFIGFMEFQNIMILNDTDSISVIIQDNLSAVDNLQMACKLLQD